MPILTNARHERFAQEVAKGKSATEAYATAGYREHRQNAARMMTNDAVQQRVAELQAVGARRTEITIGTLIDEAEEARLLARDVAQPGAMAIATKLKAELSGKLVKKVEVGGPGEFEAMTEQELTTCFVEQLVRLVTGDEEFRAMVAKKLEPILRLPAKPLTIEHDPAPDRNGNGQLPRRLSHRS